MNSPSEPAVRLATASGIGTPTARQREFRGGTTRNVGLLGRRAFAVVTVKQEGFPLAAGRQPPRNFVVFQFNFQEFSGE